jgi:hypothetical protein
MVLTGNTLLVLEPLENKEHFSSPQVSLFIMLSSGKGVLELRVH